MTKSELIEAVAQRSNITKSRAELVVNCVFDAMTAALERMIAAREKMRRLQYRPEEGGELRRLRDEVAQAVAEVEAIAGMPLSQLTGEGGITAPDDDAPVVFEVMEP